MFAPEHHQLHHANLQMHLAHQSHPGHQHPSMSGTPTKMEGTLAIAPWTQEHDRRLRAAVENVSGGRSGLNGAPPSGSTSGRGAAANAAAQSGTAGKSWSRIAMVAFPNGPHDKDACAARWRVLNQPSSIKGPWSKEEDKQLVRLVNQYGPERWVTIAEKLGTRTGKQCRERWHNHVDPTINKTSFTAEEDALIMSMYDKIGSKWAEMSKVLKGRPDNAIKNHYNTTLVRRRKLLEAVGKVNRAQTHHLEQVQQAQQLQQQAQQQEHAAAIAAENHRQQIQQQHAEQQTQHQHHQQFIHLQHQQMLPPPPASAPPVLHAQDPMFAAAVLEHRRMAAQQGGVVPDSAMSSPYMTGGGLPFMSFMPEGAEADGSARFSIGPLEDRSNLMGGAMMARSATIPAPPHARLGLPIPLQRSTSYTNGFVPPSPVPGSFLGADELGTFLAGGGDVTMSNQSVSDPSSIQFGGFMNLPHMVISSQESYNNLTPPPPPPGITLDMRSQATLDMQQMSEQRPQIQIHGAVSSSQHDWDISQAMQLSSSQQSSQGQEAGGLYVTYGHMLGVGGLPAGLVLADRSVDEAFEPSSLSDLASTSTSPLFATIPLSIPGHATTNHAHAAAVMPHTASQHAQPDYSRLEVENHQHLSRHAQHQDNQGQSPSLLVPASASNDDRDGISPKTATIELGDRAGAGGITKHQAQRASHPSHSPAKTVRASEASYIEAEASTSSANEAHVAVTLPSLTDTPHGTERQRSRERLPSLAIVAGHEALTASPASARIRNRSRTSSLVDEKQKALLLPAFKQQMSATVHKAAAAAAVANVKAANERERASPGGPVSGAPTHSTPTSTRRLRSASQLSDCTGETPSRRLQSSGMKRPRLSSVSTDVLPSTIANSALSFSLPIHSTGGNGSSACAMSMSSPSKPDTSMADASFTSTSSGKSSAAMMPSLSEDSSVDSNVTVDHSQDDLSRLGDFADAKVQPPSSSTATSAGILAPSMLANFANFGLPDNGIAAASCALTTSMNSAGIDIFSHASLHNFGFTFLQSSPSGPMLTSSPTKDKGAPSHSALAGANLLGLHAGQQDENAAPSSGGPGNARMTFGNSHLRIGSATGREASN